MQNALLSQDARCYHKAFVSVGNHLSHYETLEVSRNASPEVVRAAYKSLIQRYHPDKNPYNPAAADRAQQVSVAYAILSVPESRAAYDERLLSSEKLFADPNPSRSPAGNRHSQSPARRAESVAAKRRATVPGKKTEDTSSKFVWIVLVVVGVLFYWILANADFTRKKQEEQRAKQFVAQRQADIEKEETMRQEREQLKEKEEQIKSLDISRRTLTLFPRGLTINLIVPGLSTPRLSDRSLVISQISLIVGKIDSDRVLRNLQLNQDIVRQAVFEQLSRINESVLISLGAEEHVKDIIKTTINKITLGPAYIDELCQNVLTQQSSGAHETQCRAIETVTFSQFLLVRNENAGISPSSTNLPPPSSGKIWPMQRLHPSMSKEEVYRILGTTAQ